MHLHLLFALSLVQPIETMPTDVQIQAASQSRPSFPRWPFILGGFAVLGVFGLLGLRRRS